MTSANDVLKLIKDNDVKFADFRFTDPRGKWQHVTFDIGLIEEETFSEGQMFDGSSIAGWKAIHESDMCLMPDPNSACIDPFYAETTLVLVCDVLPLAARVGEAKIGKFDVIVLDELQDIVGGGHRYNSPYL